MTVSRRMISQLLRASLLWAVVIVVTSLAFSGTGLHSYMLIRVAFVTALISWFGAIVSGYAFSGSLIGRPYFLRLATLVAGSMIPRLGVLLMALVFGDFERLTTHFPFEQLGFLLGFGVAPNGATWQIYWGPLTVGWLVPALVIAVVDWRYRVRVLGRRTTAAGDAVEQAFRAGNAS